MAELRSRPVCRFVASVARRHSAVEGPLLCCCAWPCVCDLWRGCALPLAVRAALRRDDVFRSDEALLHGVTAGHKSCRLWGFYVKYCTGCCLWQSSLLRSVAPWSDRLLFAIWKVREGASACRMSFGASVCVKSCCSLGVLLHSKPFAHLQMIAGIYDGAAM